MSRTAVIVGASVAGVRAARALRSDDFDGRVVLIGAETAVPYDKPPLSKQFLAGDWERTRFELLAEEEQAELQVETLLGTPAERLDVAGRHVVLSDGTEVPYDVCIVATGAAARPSPWGEHPGLHVLRSIEDSARLSAALAAGGEVVVVGGGFIGAEVAATAHALGCAVTIIDPFPAPLARVVGDEIGAVLAALHEKHGVRTMFGAGVAGIAPDEQGLRVSLDDGSAVGATTVVVGIGAVPNDAWLQSSGLLVENGLVCDEYCRAVGGHDVYAAGDVARWLHRRHGDRVRVEHWTNAVEQAACVAHNIAHPDELVAFEPIEYVWSDQYDWKIQIAGVPAHAVRHQIVGDLSRPRPHVAVSYAGESGQLVGVVALNWPRASVEGRRLLMARASADDAFARLSSLNPPRVQR